MDFSLPCCARHRAEEGFPDPSRPRRAFFGGAARKQASRWLWRVLLAWALVFGSVAPAAAATAQLDELRVDRTIDGLFLYVQLNFQLPQSIDDAVRKGIPIYFVATAKVMRKRWYWYDEVLSHAERHMRVAYQPLTRQWRLNTSSGPISGDQLGLGLTRYYDTLADTLAALQRIGGWKIADLSALSGGGQQFLDFRFRLDSSQLPRTLLLSGIGADDWQLAIERRIDLSQEDAQ